MLVQPHMTLFQSSILSSTSSSNHCKKKYPGQTLLRRYTVNFSSYRPKFLQQLLSTILHTGNFLIGLKLIFEGVVPKKLDFFVNPEIKKKKSSNSTTKHPRCLVKATKQAPWVPLTTTKHTKRHDRAGLELGAILAPFFEFPRQNRELGGGRSVNPANGSGLGLLCHLRG